MSFNFNCTYVRQSDGLVINSQAMDYSPTQWEWISPTDQLAEGRLLPTAEWAFYFKNAALSPTNLRAVLMNVTQASPTILQVQAILGRTAQTYVQTTVGSSTTTGGVPTAPSVLAIPPSYKDTSNKTWFVSGITTTLFNATCSDGRKAVVYYALYPDSRQTPTATYSVYVKFYSSANVLIDFQRGQGNSNMTSIAFDSSYTWNKV